MCRLQFTAKQFYESAPIEIDSALEDWENVRQYEDEKHHAELEMLRLQTSYLLNVQLDKKSRIKDPKKLIQFGWEIEEKIKHEQSVDDQKKVLMAIASAFKNNSR